MARVKSLLVGLSIVCILSGLVVARSRWKGTTPSPLPLPSPPTSAPISSSSASTVDSAEPIAMASAAPDVEPISEKPQRCPPEPHVEVAHHEIPQSDQELFEVLLENPNALGSASIGTPTRGFLFGGVELQDSEGIHHEGGYGWGTELAIRSIERAVREVRRCFPVTPILHVGDISRDKGGWLRPHRSHQAGLDADIGYFYRVPAGWYEKATAKNLDLPRTWALVRAFIEGGNVDTIFIDLTIQRILKEFVATLPEDEQAKAEWFQSPLKKDTPIRHAWGHLTHFHVRFRDADAAALGARIKEMVPKLRKAKPGKR